MSPRAVIIDDVLTGPAREGCPGDLRIQWRIEGLDGLAPGDIGWCLEPYTTASSIRFARKGDDDFREVTPAALKGKAIHVHVSDCDGKVHSDLPAGRGIVKFAPYLQAIKELEIDGVVSLELEYSAAPSQIVAWVEEAYRETARWMELAGLRESGWPRIPTGQPATRCTARGDAHGRQ